MRDDDEASAPLQQGRTRFATGAHTGIGFDTTPA